MGQGIRGGRINQGSGSPINDLDPTVMEEDVMLDLTGYTYLGLVSNSATTCPGDTIIFWQTSVNTGTSLLYCGNDVVCAFAEGDVGRVFKLVLPGKNKQLKTRSNNDDIAVWYK